MKDDQGRRLELVEARIRPDGSAVHVYRPAAG